VAALLNHGFVIASAGKIKRTAKKSQLTTKARPRRQAPKGFTKRKTKRFRTIFSVTA
jgi:hypothetical protein